MILILGLQVNAQETKTEQRHELAFNASQFISNYLNFNGFAQTNNNYLLTYKYDLGPMRLRTGLNAFAQNSNRTDNWGNDFSSHNINFRIGVEKQKEISRKFSAFYGVDIVSMWSGSKQTQDNIELFDGNEVVEVSRSQLNTGESYGIAPVVGLQFKMTNRLSLYTEARAVFAYSENENYLEWDMITDDLRNFYGDEFFDRNFRGSYTNQFQMFIPLDVFIALSF